ncbi:MAG: TonB-dependent siderophore receptor [Burkholderiaceae bacterium]
MARSIKRHSTSSNALGAIAVAWLVGAPAWAQTAAPATSTPAANPASAAASAPAATPSPDATSTTELAPVTVTARTRPAASIAGWGDTPIEMTPLQASVHSAQQMRDNGTRRLADLVTTDPAVSDAYNSEGYWDFLSVRGFVLDNRFNYRRDGLPINAETSIPLDNKSRVEILQGTSGLQAGTSAPGGLVNFVVKRPLDAPLRSVWLEWRQPGSVTAAVDLSQRFGLGGGDPTAFGLRLNAAVAHIDPPLRSSTGERHLLALAGDWRIAPDSLFEAEFETSRQSQPSMPGFSLLGSRVPEPGDPRINLNNQPWSLPVVLAGDTTSLRFTQRLASDWRVVAHLSLQRLISDDRLAYPFGCSKEGNYDRYCSDGTFDYYAFRSDGERRATDSIDLHAQGRLEAGGLTHRLVIGTLGSRYRSRLQPRLDDATIVGSGSVNGLTIVPSLPALGMVPNTNLTERSTELYVRDTVAINEYLTAWAGLRHTRLERAGVGTDGSDPTQYTQSFTTPWLAVSYAFAPERLAYASWGRGVESEVAPNRSIYTNAGQPLPALKSRQFELGLKGTGERFNWNLAWFDISRPLFGDLCSSASGGPQTCTHQLDGSARHRGIGANASVRQGAWRVEAGTQWLRARREGSQTAALDGMQPTNVPELTLKLQADYAVASNPGLTLQGGVLRESSRMVLPDNSVRIPGITRVTTGARFETRSSGVHWTWRAGIDNLLDQRAWRESPYQYGHAYLFPLAPRTLRVSVQADL